MTHTTHKIIPALSVVDESYDSAKSAENYFLLLDVANDSLSFTIYDKTRNQFLCFEKYSHTVSDEQGLTHFLEQVFSQNRMLLQTFVLTRLSYQTEKFTLVPNALFDKEKCREFLAFNNALNDDDFILHHQIKSDDCTTVYAVKKGVHDVLTTLLPQAEWRMSCASILEYMSFLPESAGEKQVFVHVENSYFYFCVSEGRKLMLFNRYSYSNTEDFVYFLLFVCGQLSINLEQIEMNFCGNIERRSAYFEAAQHYVKHLKLSKRPAQYSFSYGFDKIPESAGFNLFNLLLCA